MFFATPYTYIVFLIMGQTFWADFLSPSVVMCVLALLGPARMKRLKTLVIFGTGEQIKHLHQFINTLSGPPYIMGGETLNLLVAALLDCGH